MHRHLKVLLVGPYPQEEGKIRGGVQAVISYLADGIAARQDVEVHVVSSVPGLSSPVDRVTTTGVNVHLVPLFGKFGCLTGFAVDARRIGRVLKQVSPDIVHVHTQMMYPHAVSNKGYPVVLTAHGVHFKEAELAKGFTGQLRARMASASERGAVESAEHIILISRYLEKMFGNMLNGAKLHYIDNAIDDKFFQIPNRSEPDAVLFAGVITERKGVLCLIKAAAILRDNGAKARFWIVGPVGDKEYFAQVKRFVSENKLDDCIEFTGMVSQDEVMDRYSRCGMLVLPSFEETSPMVISQAHAASKPVVASDSAGIPYMVTEGETGYLVPFGDAVALADRIRRLIEDPDSGRRMGEAARKQAEARYSWSVVIEKTIQVYQEVLAGY